MLLLGEGRRRRGCCSSTLQREHVLAAKAFFKQPTGTALDATLGAHRLCYAAAWNAVQFALFWSRLILPPSSRLHPSSLCVCTPLKAGPERSG
jgi:hypothetical protein